MKSKYLVFRDVWGYGEYDSYDCYHECSTAVHIPTDCIFELEDKEVEFIKKNLKGYMLLPLVTKDELNHEINSVIAKAKEKARIQEENKRKKELAAKKRAAAKKAKQEKKEREEFERLKNKFKE